MVETGERPSHALARGVLRDLRNTVTQTSESALVRSSALVPSRVFLSILELQRRSRVETSVGKIIGVGNHDVNEGLRP